MLSGRRKYLCNKNNKKKKKSEVVWIISKETRKEVWLILQWFFISEGKIVLITGEKVVEETVMTMEETLEWFERMFLPKSTRIEDHRVGGCTY